MPLIPDETPDALPDKPAMSGMAPDGAIVSMLAETVRALQEVEPTAYLVLPRVLRRVIREEWDLPSLTQQIPHRKTRIVSRNTLIRHVDWDELGLKPDAPLPERVILIARPDDQQLEQMSSASLRHLVWRLLFHSSIHAAYEKLRADQQLSAADFRNRIHELGQVEFDEIHAVLRREHFLPPECSLTEVYIEFAALFCELRFFAPHCLNSYFPSFHSTHRVLALLNQDLQVEALLQKTRLPGADNSVASPREIEADETDIELDSLTGHDREPGGMSRKWYDAQAAENSEAEDLFPARTNDVLARIRLVVRPNLRVFSRQIRRADKAFSRGNAVGAALQQIRAAKWATPELLSEAVSGALADLQRLVRRLQSALNFDEFDARRWYDALVSLLLLSDDGFWSVEKRLLYDLQKVCVDHEREIYTVDLVGWALSFGRRPVKRPLSNQREVLMSKHLRSATRRLVSSRLAGNERRQLSNLLHDAAQSAERQMRSRLRPLASGTLQKCGFCPKSTPERVAFNKLVEELLDGVAHRGFLTMGDMRDAMSRSNLKMNDLAGVGEFLSGDVLLRADQAFHTVLDGVYQKGDFYLRWLQRLSAGSFGTQIGRFATRYIAIPYGAALMVFDAVAHIAELIVEKRSATGILISEWRHETIFALGTFLVFVIHVAPFRRFVLTGVRSALKAIRRIVYDWPLRLFRLPLVKQILKSSPIILLRKFVLWPIIPTALICWGLPEIYTSIPRQTSVNWLVVWAAMSVVLNSRVGRDVEELTAEWVYHTWTRIRVHIVVALFDLVMESFKRVLEWIDRVLYAVDEWLRFKSGETMLSLGIKAILGVVWYAFTFVLRFCLNLLIEPQINPIKHFPVVTVSHKLLLPLAITTSATTASPLAAMLMNVVPVSVANANAIAATVVWGIPGVFGFLVWELKSNWRLYHANRNAEIAPVIVGSHGETLIRLMKPGFHSGTLPKLFGRLRRVDRRRRPGEHSLARSRYLDQLHHVHVSISHFVERELLELLRESSWNSKAIEIKGIHLASNNIRILLSCVEISESNLEIVFEEQSGWLVASVAEGGWVRSLPDESRRVFVAAMLGFFRLAGVDLVREQIAAAFADRKLPYDIAENGLKVWPDGHFADEAVYQLGQSTIIRPWPRLTARTWSLPTVDSASLIFRESSLNWADWDNYWDNPRGELSRLLPARFLWQWQEPNRE